MRTIGIELEFGDEKFIDKHINNECLKDIILSSIRSQLKDDSIQLRKRSSKSDWAFKKDHCGYEITTPVFLSSLSGTKIIPNVSQYIYNQLNPKMFNFGNCGVHVHLGVEDLSTDDLYNLYKVFYRFEPVIMNMFHKKRKESAYIDFLRKDLEINILLNKQKLLKKSIGENFKKHRLAVNVRQKGNLYERIEVRYCPGTMSYEIIFRWIQFLLTMIEISKYRRIMDEDLTKRQNIVKLIDFLTKSDIETPWLRDQLDDLILWIKYRMKNRNSF